MNAAPESDSVQKASEVSFASRWKRNSKLSIVAEARQSEVAAGGGMKYSTHSRGSEFKLATDSEEYLNQFGELQEEDEEKQNAADKSARSEAGEAKDGAEQAVGSAASSPMSHPARPASTFMVAEAISRMASNAFEQRESNADADANAADADVDADAGDEVVARGVDAHENGGSFALDEGGNGDNGVDSVWDDEDDGADDFEFGKRVRLVQRDSRVAAEEEMASQRGGVTSGNGFKKDGEAVKVGGTQDPVMARAAAAEEEEEEEEEVEEFDEPKAV